LLGVPGVNFPLAHRFRALFCVSDRFRWYIIWILISVLIYWMGHVGIYNWRPGKNAKKSGAIRWNTQALHVYEKQKNEHVAAFEAHVVQQKRIPRSGTDARQDL